MKTDKTINEVLKQGQKSINLPVGIIMIGTPVLSFFIAYYLLPKVEIGFAIPMGFVLGFILAWIWWSFKVVKWRIWAFEHIKKSDWVDLKLRAITELLIWPDGSVFEKTEFRSTYEKRRIEAINKEILQLVELQSAEEYFDFDLIEDDPSVPESMTFYYVKSELILSAILPLVFIIIGFYFLTTANIFHGLLSMGFALYIFDLKKVSNISNNKRQLFISEKGIDMNFEELEFVEWKDTENISINTANRILRLGLWYKNEYYDIQYPLNDINIGSYDELPRVINIYLKRYWMKS